MELSFSTAKVIFQNDVKVNCNADYFKTYKNNSTTKIFLINKLLNKNLFAKKKKNASIENASMTNAMRIDTTWKFIYTLSLAFTQWFFRSFRLFYN